MQFEHRKSNEPYMLIAAGSGSNNIEFPDGYVTSCRQIKKDLGYPQLLAWMNEKKELLEWVEELRKNPNHPCKLVVDSSAYSAWTRGLEVDIDKYIEFINEISDVVYWFAELDKIPGTFGGFHTEEELKEAPEISWKNFLYMIERVNCPKKILPIYHMGEDLKYLYQILDYRFPDGSKIEYMGISPDNGVHVNDKIKWYEEIWKIIKESSNPDILTHNFGCTTVSIMEQYPSMSSDSTSWLRHASFGKIILVVNGKVKTISVSDRRYDSNDHIYNLSSDVQKAVQDMCDEIGHGLTIDTLVNHDSTGKLRLAFNLYSLNKWRKSFIYNGTDIYKNNLW